MRRARVSAEMPAGGTGREGALGRSVPAISGPPPILLCEAAAYPAADPVDVGGGRSEAAAAAAGITSYAIRLMLSRCFGEMLSDVMFPPYPPQPSVIDGSRPVVRPIDPSVEGEFTTMRNAGFSRPNCRITSSFREWIDIVCPIPP